MGLLAWVMMGLAIWHFTIFLPDRFWGGIVGAFVGSLVGAIVVGLIIYAVKVSSLKIPGESATDIAVALYAIPGALIGMGLVYLEGMRRERSAAHSADDSLSRAAVPSRAGRTVAAMPDLRFELAACPSEQVARLRRELGVSGALAQVLVRRGLGEPDSARAFLDAAEEHPPSDFTGIEQAVEPILAHVSAATPDHDPRRLRRRRHLLDGDPRARAARAGRRRRLLPARPHRRRLRPRGGDGQAPGRREARACSSRSTARSRPSRRWRSPASSAWTWSSPTTTPRARTAQLPDAPIVHPALCGYPCPELCATAVAYKLAQALFAAAGRDPRELRVDLDLVALATVADVVPLLGENRTLVRRGLRALAATRQAGPARADGRRARGPRRASTSARSASRWRRD